MALNPMQTTINRLQTTDSKQFFSEFVCFLKQETLHSLLSTGWFHERIQACFTLTELLVSQLTKIDKNKL